MKHARKNPGHPIMVLDQEGKVIDQGIVLVADVAEETFRTRQWRNLRWRTPYTYPEFPSNNEINTQPSLTVPDQTMSIQEILSRYARGIEPDNVRTPIYEGEDAMPDISKMDLADQQAFREAVEEELDGIKSHYAEKVKKAEEEKEARKRAKKRSYEEQELPYEESTDEDAPSDGASSSGAGERSDPTDISYKNPPGGSPKGKKKH